MLLDDDDEEALEQDESPAKPAPRAGGASGRRALVQDSSDDEMADAQPPRATATAAGERWYTFALCCSTFHQLLPPVRVHGSYMALCGHRLTP